MLRMQLSNNSMAFGEEICGIFLYSIGGHKSYPIA